LSSYQCDADTDGQGARYTTDHRCTTETI
jgi:hypothetical protein